MSPLLKYVIDDLKDSNEPKYLEKLVTSFLLKVENMIEDSTEFDCAYRTNIRLLKNNISEINDQIRKDGFDGKGIEYITPDKNAVKCGKNFPLIVQAFQKNYEDANRFADRIGYEILKRFNCKKEDIHITSNTKDGGIDFWGRLYKNIESLTIGYELIIAGQIKKYKSKVNVKDIREFIGAISSAMIGNYFSNGQISNHNPVIMVFVTTSSLTQSAYKIALEHKIIIISKYHLSRLGLY